MAKEKRKLKLSRDFATLHLGGEHPTIRQRETRFFGFAQEHRPVSNSLTAKLWIVVRFSVFGVGGFLLLLAAWLSFLDRLNSHSAWLTILLGSTGFDPLDADTQAKPRDRKFAQVEQGVG